MVEIRNLHSSAVLKIKRDDVREDKMVFCFCQPQVVKVCSLDQKIVVELSKKNWSFAFWECKQVADVLPLDVTPVEMRRRRSISGSRHDCFLEEEEGKHKAIVTWRKAKTLTWSFQGRQLFVWILSLNNVWIWTLMNVKQWKYEPSTCFSTWPWLSKCQ